MFLSAFAIEYTPMFKAKDLKYPYLWNDRRPAIQDGVLFIPSFYDKHEEFVHPGWDSPQIFNRKGASTAIEFCSGNGMWIAEKAKAYPDINWIAVEKNFERVQKIWARKKRENLTNVFIIAGKAEEFISFYLKVCLVRQVFINFPDPWPKTKHAKNRLLSLDFVNKLAHFMAIGGTMMVVTDDEVYSKQTISTLQAASLWKVSFEAPHYVEEVSGYGSSYFEDLWRKKNKTIRYMQFERL